MIEHREKSALAKARGLIETPEARRLSSLRAGIAIDMLWAAINIVMSIAYQSWWCFTLGCYYILLASMRVMVHGRLRVRDRSNSEVEQRDDNRLERVCGVELIVSILVLSGIVTLAMRNMDELSYPEIMVYGIATFTFYSLATALTGLIRSRRSNDALILTNYRVNTAIALVSLFTMEVAMLHAFATAEDALLVFVMPIITGTGVALGVLALGIACIAHSRKRTDPKGRG